MINEHRNPFVPAERAVLHGRTRLSGDGTGEELLKVEVTTGIA
jgi:hypothetical protein